MPDHRLLKKAFKIIRRNYGCPGNDGISIAHVRRNYFHFERVQIQKLEDARYEFDQFPKKVTIHDYLGKRREVFVYSVLDRWAQEFIKLKINPFVEQELSDRVFGYRQKRHDVDSYAYILRNRPRFVLKIDIKDFFHHINRAKVFQSLAQTQAPDDTIELARKSLKHCPVGLPQGNVLSCMLSNLALAGFDRIFPENYTRYGDDMMFSCDTESEAYDILDAATGYLRARGFIVNDEKTKIISKPTIEKLT